MGETHSGLILRGEASSQRATFLELFLDLVFVFALTRVSQRLITDFTTEQRILLSEAGQTLLLFLALWLLWATTAWITSTLEPDALAVQVVVVVTVVGSMVMAVALPQGFGERGLVFAGAYVSVQIGRILIFLLATHGRADPTDPAAPLRVLFWSGLTAVPWIIGGLLGEGAARGVLWSLAVTVDYIALTLGWPAPRLGRTRFSGQTLAEEHLAERYQQFLLIALGESIFVIGVTFSGGGGAFTPARTGAFGLALLTTVLFWRIYFYRAGQVLPLAITRARDPARLGQSVAYTHLTMIAGIVLTGVGYELSIAHPLGHNPPAWLFAVLGGPALFLVGRAGFEYQVFGRVSRSRVAGLILLGAVVPAMLNMSPLTIAGTAAGILLGVALLDFRRSHGRAPEQPAPPI
ncbi:low temperature requirement protein A [Plantactinospora soyae]|uniref:Low temperature requirement protein LtrA n=1 Tax=Plantactinospora soyae TaxID=1544732 RepID=A0A927M7C5_9ACTN|nr:low temperature requirement protein A [Plantactinospora soyae]MBE1488051.1 low temperature requirement protein LtrA [Plantactinospora soyae]